MRRLFSLFLGVVSTAMVYLAVLHVLDALQSSPSKYIAHFSRISVE